MKKMLRINRLAAAGLLAVLLLMSVTPAQAFTPRSGETVVVQAGEVIDDDLYAGANTVIVKGTIKGDLIAGGSLVRIEPGGVVEGDLIAAGQGVVIQGAVNGDVRIAGFSLAVEKGAQVGEDLLAFGYSLDLQPETTVGRDLVAGAGVVSLAGEVGGNVSVSGEGVKIDGAIGGDVAAEVGSGDAAYTPFPFMRTQTGVPEPIRVPGGLTIGPDAVISGDLTYSSPEEGSISGTVEGETSFTPIEADAQGRVAPPAPTAADRIAEWLLSFLRTLAALLVIGLILAYFFPGVLRDGADTLESKPLASFLWGIVAYAGFFLLFMLITLVVFSAAIILGVITLGNLAWTTLGLGAVSLTAMAIGFHIAVAYISKILVGYLVGRWLFVQVRPASSENRFWPVVVGILIFALLESIPFVGLVFNVFITLFGLGALFILLRERYARQRRPGPEEVQGVSV